MADRTDLSSLQIIERSLLEVVSKSSKYSGVDNNKQANSSTLKSILGAVNAELKPAYWMSESTTPDLIVNIAADLNQNPENLKQNIHSHTDGSFSSGTITFPSADAGNIIVSPGTNTTLSLTSGNFKKILIQVDESGQLSVKQGLEAATISAASVPEADGRNLPIGYVVLENVAGVIQNIQNTKIFQYINQNSNLSLTVQEVDGAPKVSKVTKIKFPNDTITDDGNGVVTVDLSKASFLVNDIGNSIIKLKPSITSLTLQSPDGTIWGFTVGNDGIAIAQSGSTNPITNLKIQRDDGIEASFRVDNTGLLQVITPADAGTSLVNNIFLDSPEGVAWELRVTTTAGNFILESPSGLLYNVGVNNIGQMTTSQVNFGLAQNVKVKRDDLTEVGVGVSDLGNLLIENPTVGGESLKDNIYLTSPDTSIWEVKVSNTDTIYTVTTTGVVNKNILYTSTELSYANKFQIQNDKAETLFSVREFEETDNLGALQTGAFVEMPILTNQQLRAIEFPLLSSANVTAEVYLDTGTGIRKVFYDTFDSEWKYMHNLAIVFP